MGTQRRGLRWRLGILRNHVRHQLLASLHTPLVKGNGACIDPGRSAQLGLDFSQLNAKPAELHLVVCAAHKIHAAIGRAQG
ncbi:hypothetical protein LYNGBM3L_75540 [Moorena producens 3L]|uniref:Uncharacterized protein n=1 Tax=Moorena producens 3L TaxID=489825 RepID=F4XRD9_9CYAN|nr:hypothetical protein LYNGBM3L_75540 [Moorena producens 3L]